MYFRIERYLHTKVYTQSVNKLYSIAFTHNHLPVETLGLLHIEQEHYETRLKAVKKRFRLTELYYLSTCNRVEFTFVSDNLVIDLKSFTNDLLFYLFPEISSNLINDLVGHATFQRDIHVVEHLISVAASIDSMVVGEREIITQVRKAFEICQSVGLTGDKIRLVMRQVIETAKKVYSQTSISNKPVSIVSLAYHELKRFQILLDAKILVVGSGATNTTLCRFLKKHGFKHFSIFNRTLAHAEKLANEMNGKAYSLDELTSFSGGFDVLVTCTSADHHVIDKKLYTSLLNGDLTKKIIIDLAIPRDIDPLIIEEHHTEYISITYLQQISNTYLKIRHGELSHVNEIIQEALLEFDIIDKERNVELVMRQVPIDVKRIKETALNEVFKAELQNITPETRELLEKIVGYMEKKYISGPMKKAKEILLSNVQKNEN